MGKITSRASRALWAIPEWFVTYLPGPQGEILRFHYWKSRMRHVGTGVTFGVGVRVSGAEFISIGDHTWIDDQVILLAGAPDSGLSNITRKANDSFPGREGDLIIGANCHIAQQVTLQAHGGLFIGDESGVASGSRLYSLSHHYKQPGALADATKVYKFTPRAAAEDQTLVCSPVVMEADTALGLNSVMLPGATIGTGSWVGVLSVVTGAIPPNSVASGIPAEIKRKVR